MESGRLSTHLGPWWKRKCVQHPPSFLSSPKESGSRIFSTPLPLSLSTPILPYLTTQPSTIALLRLPAVQSISLVNHSLKRNTSRRIIRINSRLEEERSLSKIPRSSFRNSLKLVQRVFLLRFLNNKMEDT